LGQLERQPRALRMLEIERQRALVAVDRGEDGAHAALAVPVPHVVPAPGPLHLHDVGAEIRQQQRAVWSGHDAREIEDAKPLQHQSRERKPSVIALTSGMPFRAMALIRAFTSASGRNGLAASRSANARTSLASASAGTTRWTRPRARASSAA